MSADDNRALPTARATHEPSPDGLGHSVGVPNANTLVESLARIIALHGLGTVSGVDRHAPPTPEWDQDEYRTRILELIPVAAEARCRALADAVLDGIYSVSNDREIDDGIRTVPGYAAEIIRKRDPGMVGLILNLGRLQDVLDTMAAREVCAAQGIEAGTATTGTGAVHESPVPERNAP